MAQKINLHNNFNLYKILLGFFFSQSFVNFAIFSRCLVLLVLVGFKFLNGGINSFLKYVYFIEAGLLAVLSIGKLIPIKLPGLILDNWLKVYLIWIFQSNLEITRHPTYAYIIFDWSLVGGLQYIYHYYKLKTLNKKVPASIGSLHRYLVLLNFPIQTLLEFILLFLNLKYDNSYFSQIVLLFFVPTKFFLFKRLVYKYYFLESKTEHIE